MTATGTRPPAGGRGGVLRGRRRGRRVPIVLQVDDTESGPASLAMVLAHHGRHVPLAEVVAACSLGREGASAQQLVETGRAYGLEVVAVERALAELDATEAPVLRWRGDGWVVLEGREPAGLRVVDPATGPLVVPLADAERLYGGTALLARPTSDFVTGSTTPSVLTDLRRRLRPARAGIALGATAGLFLLVPGLLLPIVVTQLASAVLQPQDRTNVLPLLVVLVISAALIGVLTLLQGWFRVRAQARLTAAGSFRFVDHLLHLPVRYFAQRADGMAVTRLGQVDSVYSLVTGPLVSAAVGLVGIVVYGVVMVVFSPALAAVVIGALVVNVLVLLLIARRRRELNLVQLRQGSRLSALEVGLLSGVEGIKAAGRDDAAFERWAGHQAGYLLAAQRVGRLNNRPEALPIMLALLTTVVLLGVGATSVMSGALSLGVLVGFQALATSFLAPAGQLVSLGRQGQTVWGRLAEVNDVLATPVDPAFDSSAADEDGPGSAPLRGSLEVRAVTFGYARSAGPVLEDVTLTLTPGSRVAVVGASGSGKSTLLKLVLGLHEPWAGEVLFDGRPRSGWDHRHLGQAVAVVDQRVMLFGGTVRDNLTLWDASVPTDQLIAAAQDAGIHDEIAARPGGYDAEVLERGRNFSGGQRQRLEIARALVSDPAILVLDEATSALDTATEKEIDRNLRRRGATCLIVAHRLSTVRDCDEIVVLDGGRVAERGTHEELVAAGGRYARLVDAE